MSAESVINTLIGMDIPLSVDDKETIGVSLQFGNTDSDKQKIINGYISRQVRLRENA
jgi:hypothetical protein